MRWFESSHPSQLDLHTTYLFDKLTKDELMLLRSYRNYGRMCCFTGFDSYSFAFNAKVAEAVMRSNLRL